jgi:hypothetical protein
VPEALRSKLTLWALRPKLVASAELILRALLPELTLRALLAKLALREVTGRWACWRRIKAARFIIHLPTRLRSAAD